jgi:peptidyl-Lys metalloendopeptidase
MTGTDSQGGTIIHELAHFTVVAGTGDHAYTHANAKPLAQTNPAKALANSDSLQYFAENNPRLN